MQISLWPCLLSLSYLKMLKRILKIQPDRMPSVCKQVEQVEIKHTADINWYNYFRKLTLFEIAKDQRQLDNLDVHQQENG